jgi:hypothetical protein
VCVSVKIQGDNTLVQICNRCEYIGRIHLYHLKQFRFSLNTFYYYYYYYYYLFTAIGFAPGGSGPYTTQLQQKTYITM